MGRKGEFGPKKDKMERRCCARVAPGVEPTIVFGTLPVAGSRTLQAFVFDLGSNLGSIHFFLSKLLSVVVSIYWQGPTGTRLLIFIFRQVWKLLNIENIKFEVKMATIKVRYMLLKHRPREFSSWSQ